MTFVKICGLRTAEHALAALDTGADLLGFIFAPARRQISPSQAAAIGTAVRAAGRATLVGVFVNEAPEHMLDIADTCGLDALQLSGDEPLAIARQLAGRELIKTVRLNQAAGEMDWLECDLPNVRLLVDAHVPGAYGGAGVVADWPRASALASRRPVILAGGLTPSNVGAAIRQVRPWAVDVSSGVETEGVKDVAKIRAFVAAARATEADRHAGP